MSTPSLCINCNNEVSSAYCPSCGQKNPPKKISILNLYGDFQSRIYGFDGMFPRTLKDLLLRPGQVARSYISGNRVQYVGPVGYFFLMVTIFILSLSMLGVDFYELSQASSPFGRSTTTQEQEEGSQILVKMLSDNLRTFQFTLIPLTAIWFKIFFRKSGYSFLEMMVPSFYLYGFLEVFSIINVVVFSITTTSINSYFFPISFLYFGFACTGMFGKGIGSFLKGVLVYAVSFLTFMLCIIVFVLVVFLSDPELMEKMRPQ